MCTVMASLPERDHQAMVRSLYRTLTRNNHLHENESQVIQVANAFFRSGGLKTKIRPPQLQENYRLIEFSLSRRSQSRVNFLLRRFLVWWDSVTNRLRSQGLKEFSPELNKNA
jgi:hypothetical protein